MAELGELSLWAALPFLALAGPALIAAGSRGRSSLATFGGRAVEVGAVLLLIAIAGLGFAIVEVRLDYAYVAAYSGFQLAPAWRLAALWSGPAAGALCLTFLFVSAGAVGLRLERSRQAAVRTGAMSILAAIALVMVLARTRPFDPLPSPAAVGSGLPLALQSPAWQVEIIAAYLAAALGSISFTGVVAEHLRMGPGRRRLEGIVVALAAALLGVSLLAAAWRAYSQTGELLGAEGLALVVPYAPAFLLACAHLHAPDSPVAPAWASRWRRILELAFFPAVLGAWAAGLLAAGGIPPASPWTGGFAVGVISGAIGGVRRLERGGEELKDVPGFGPWAFGGGLLCLLLGGVGALSGLVRVSFWADVAWPLILLAVAGAVGWTIYRPIAVRRRVWPLALIGGAAGYGLLRLGWSEAREPLLTLGVALLAALAVGSVAEVVRLRAVAKIRRRDPPVGHGLRTFERRRSRRRASLAAHLGVALVVVGLAAGSVANRETRPLYPGDRVRLATGFGREVEVTYLGLSRYHVGDYEKQVASFRLDRKAGQPELLAAETSYDMRRAIADRRPALRRGALFDVVVGIAGFLGGEGISGHVAARPLTNLVWLGGALLMISLALRKVWFL